MEWGSISTLIAEVLFGGGLLAFVTIKDKKTAAILDNMQKVIDTLTGQVEEYKQENKELKEENRSQEAYIRDLHKEISTLSERLDKANSRAAVNKLLKCQEIGCDKRKPPLGEGVADTFRQIRTGNLGEEEDHGN